MSTISSTLALQDKISKPMQSIVKAMNSTLVVIRSIKGAELGPEFAQAAADAKLATAAIDQMNQSLNEVKNNKGFESQEGQITAFNAALEVSRKGLALVKSGINEIGKLTGLYDVQKQAETSLAVVLANQGVAFEDYKSILEEASAIQAKTTIGDETMIAGLAELATYISDTEALTALMPTFADFAIGMNEGAPELGTQAAVSYATALGKALQGQYEGLTKKGFIVSESQKAVLALQDDSVKSLKTLDKQTRAYVESVGLEAAKVAIVAEVTTETWGGLAEAIAGTDAGKIIQMNNATGDLKETIGGELYPYVLQFKELLTSALNPALEAIAEHMDVIAPIAIVLAATLGTLAVIIGVVTVAQWLWNTAILANPLTWIIVGIVAVVAAIAVWINSMGGVRAAWETVVDAVLSASDKANLGFKTGVYAVLNLWDKMSLGMSKAGAAIAGYMGDMKVNVLTILQNMVNGAIDIINKFIGALGSIPGVSIEAIEHVTFAATAAAENEAAKQGRAADIATAEADMIWNQLKRQEAIDTMAAEARAAHSARQANIAELRATGDNGDLIEGIFKSASGVESALGDVTSGSGGGKALKTTGEVKISGEDIKLLMDLATIDYQVTYQTLTPQLSLNIDTIRETVDVNYVVEEIAAVLEEAADSRVVLA